MGEISSSFETKITIAVESVASSCFSISINAPASDVNRRSNVEFINVSHVVKRLATHVSDENLPKFSFSSPRSDADATRFWRVVVEVDDFMNQLLIYKDFNVLTNDNDSNVVNFVFTDWGNCFLSANYATTVGFWGLFFNSDILIVPSSKVKPIIARHIWRSAKYNQEAFASRDLFGEDSNVVVRPRTLGLQIGA